MAVAHRLTRNRRVNRATVLRAIALEPGISFGRLTATFGFDPSDLKRALEHAQRDGLVRKRLREARTQWAEAEWVGRIPGYFPSPSLLKSHYVNGNQED